MEIKHTVEILTKDIQDIEKLVRNLNNYTTPPQIELDLALSKLRNVYELISMISTDAKSDNAKSIQKKIPSTDASTRPSQKPEEPKAQIKESVLQIVESEPKSAPEPEPELEPEPSITAPEPNINAPEPADSIPETIVVPPAPNPPPPSAPLPETPPAQEPIIEQEPIEQKATTTEPKPVLEAAAPPQHEASILGETFKQDESINEKNAEKETNGMSTILAGKPIESIKRNVGINDRFLIIREVMNGDNEGYNELIQKLDECPNFNQAFQLMETRFPDNLEHEGVQVLVNLARRKFISRGNV